jgi:alkylation response protein AidB-like acyl-CoA dehydrogenase
VLVEGGTEARLFDGMPGLDFDLADAPAEILARGNAAAERIARAAHFARVALLHDTAGAAEAAVSLTRDYLSQRRQFGRALSQMQVLRHRLVDMAIAAQEIEAVARHAALAPPGPDPALAAALAFAARRGRRIAEEAVQFHGGIGVTEEARISRVFRRLVRLGFGFGGEAALTREATAGERLLEP